MASPTQFIEITDFSPGIFGDLHALSNQHSASDPTSTKARSTLMNGAATIENTHGCRADISGALVPLPIRQPFLTMEGVTQPQQTTPSFMPADIRGMFLLDAQIGVPYENESASTDEGIFTMWGFVVSPGGDGAGQYLVYALGREFRPWTTTDVLPEGAIDFMFSAVDTPTSLHLPPAQLTAVRFYYGSSTHADKTNELYRQRWAIPVVVGLIAWTGTGVISVGGQTFKQGTIATDEKTFLTRVWGEELNASPSGELIDAFQHYSPTIGWGGSGSTLGGYTARTVVIGSNLNHAGLLDSPIVPTTGINRGHLWSFHIGDDGSKMGDDADSAVYPENLLRAPYLMVAHQGRLVMLERSRADIASSELTTEVSGITMDTRDDSLWYSEYGLPLQDNFEDTYEAYGQYPADERSRQYYLLTVAEDIIAGSGAMGTVTNDQLLIVKHRGGAVLISGDLDNPTVRRLPSVESTHGVISKGAQTPVGFVYGSRNGIFTWQGGDASVKLSRQIEGFFWDHTHGSSTEIYAGSRGRFGYWNGFVCVPNSFLYDTMSDSWWKFESEDAIPYNCYEESSDGSLLAFKYKHAPHVDSEHYFCFKYNEETLRDTYSWQSHPLVETQGRKLSFQNVEILATGHDQSATTIDVYLTGFDQEGTPTTIPVTTLTLAATRGPQLLRADIAPNFRAEYVQVRLEASSTDTDHPAPKIHRVRFGVSERATTIRHGGTS
jgi:hypothetical protein